MRQTRHRAGSGSREIFRDRRRATLRENWRDWATISAALLAMLVLMIVLSGWARVIGAIAFGFGLAIALVMWMVGDITSITFAWGAIGEEQTEEELDRLGPDWFVEHDIPNDYGNWDHVVVGPPGIFLIDSKRYLSATATVADDTLRVGSRRVAGKSFRGGAFGLKRALEARGVQRPYVHAVVAIWGDFPQDQVEVEHVAYVAGASLIAWLRNQPPQASPERVARIAAAVKELRP